MSVRKRGVRRFSRKKIANWLVCTNFIEEIEIGGRRIKRPTEAGIELGIIAEEREGEYGPYNAILYNRDAQQFIIDNIDALLACGAATYRARMNIDNQGKRWEKEEDQKLVELFKEGLSLREIAAVLKRREKAIRFRLRNCGFNPDAEVRVELLNSDSEMP